MSELDEEAIDGRWRLTSAPRDVEGGPWPAKDELLGRDVVVWLRAADRELDPSQEARARVHHPALVQLHEARRAVRGPRDVIGRSYVVADPLPGAALAELLARGERLDPARLASLALDTLAALETLHALGLAHGAVSPATLRLGLAGTSGAALAPDPLRAAPPAGAGTATPTARQTPARADLRALAEALYEAATGRKPDPAAPIPLRGLRPDLPAGVERVVLDLLEDGPGARGGPGLAAQARTRLAEAAGLEAGPRPGVVEPRFVGRDDALADIAAALDEAQALAAAGRAAREAAPAGARAAFVLVSAPAGLGKTRLLHEAAAAHARAGARPLLLQAQVGADAYAPWRAALERAATWSDGAPARDALAALLSPVLDPLVRHERVARGLLALGARRPLLLLVDDGHRLSEAAAALLLHVARSAATPGAPGAAAVVVASRPAEVARPSPLLSALAAPLAPLHHAAPLEELPAVEAEELAASLLPEGTPRDEVERLARRGGGSPFLLGELAAQLRSAGPGGRPAAAAPASVQDALRARLGRLGRDARALLDALAAVGRPLPAPAIEGVLLHAQAGEPAQLAGRAREARAELDALGLARPTEGAEEGGAGGLALRHGATREVALEALDAARARALAGVVLRALDRAAPLAAGDRARLALVAHEPGAAEAALAAAAADAAPDELLEAASQALPAGPVRARVQRDLARARLRRGAFQGARAAVAAALAEAGDDAEQAGLRAEAELIQGDAAFLEGDLRGAAEAAGRGRAALGGPPSPTARGLGPLLAKLLALSAKVATQRGDHAEAAARLAEARAAVAGVTGEDSLRDRLAVDEATAWVLALDRARYAEARARIEAAVRAREAAGDEAGLLHAERALGMHAYYAGDMPRAEACFKAALGRCERVSDPSLAAGLWNNLGLVAREQGALRRAEVALERALDLAERLGQAAVLCRALTNVGRVRRSLGDLRGAARSFRRAAGVAATGGDAVIESAALTELGSARLEAGRPRAALAAIGRGLAIRRARGDAGRVGESCLELGEVWRAAGDPRAALTCAARALALHAALGNAEAAAAAVEAMEAAAGRPGGPAAALEEAHRGVRIAGPPALRAAAAKGERLARLARRALAAAVAARAGDAELALVHARRVRRLARAVERQADLTGPVRALGASLALEARALVLEGGPGAPAAAALDRALALPELPAARKVALQLRRALTAEAGAGDRAGDRAAGEVGGDAGLPRGLAQRRDVLRALAAFQAGLQPRAGAPDALRSGTGLAEARESARRLGDVALLAALADARAAALARSGDDEAHTERALAEQALARLSAGLPATLARGLARALEPLVAAPTAAPAPTAPAARALEALDAAASVEAALGRALEAAAEATSARRGLALVVEPGEPGADRWSAEAAPRGALARHGLAPDAPPPPAAWAQAERAARDGLAVAVRAADGAALAVPARAARRTLAVLWLERATPFDDAARASAQAVAARLARALAALAPAAARERAPDRAAPAGRPEAGDGAGGGGEGRLIGGSPPMRAVHRLIERYGRTTAPVTIHGESGTGKELVASALHRASPRREGPFVAFNCSAVADTLLESELFGVVKGAFTGADRDRKGLFELAHGGTLFMDEVGDMSLDMQAKLLRVLETGELRPVGGRQVVHVDARIISATHHDLRRLVSEGRMREDLFYRLNVLRIELPPLRERREDVPLLAAHILAQAALTHGGPPKRLAPDALDQLLRHPFPGNVRELKNVLERACVLEPGPVLGAGRLLLDGPPAPGATSAGAAAYQRVFSYQGVELNRRQRQVLDHLEAGAAAVTNREFCAMASVSERTGLRDLAELVERGVLVRLGKRKGARYRLANNA